MRAPVKLFLCLFLLIQIKTAQAEGLKSDDFLKNQTCLSLSDNINSIIYNLDHQVQAYLTLVDACAAPQHKGMFYKNIISNIHQRQEASTTDKWRLTKQIVFSVLEKHKPENISDFQNETMTWETLQTKIQQGSIFLKPSAHHSNTEAYIAQVNEKHIENSGQLSSVNLSSSPLNPLLICQNTDFVNQTLLPLSQTINSAIQNIMKETSISDQFTFLHTASRINNDFIDPMNFPSLIQWQGISSHFISQVINKVSENTLLSHYLDENQLESLSLWEEANDLIEENITQYCSAHPFLLDKNVEEMFITFQFDNSFLKKEERKKHLNSIQEFILQSQKGSSLIHSSIDADFRSMYLHLVKPL